MDPKKFASVFGTACLAVGVLSLVPSLTGATAGLPELQLPYSYGNFLGLFPLNIVNKLMLLALGVLGITSASAKFNALPRSIGYARLVMGLTLSMGLLGLFPQTNTFFGYWPLFGTANVTSSLLFAAVSGFFGYYLSSKVPDSGPAVRDFTSPITSR